MSHRLHLPDARPGAQTVAGAAFHYLHRVLRLSAGATLEVFDGKGQAYDARVERVNDDALELVLGPAHAAPLGRAITVVQGLPKGDKLELVLQKGTELGAAGFAVVATERSVAKLDGKEAAKHARWLRIVEEAARQCQRNDVPSLAAPVSLAQWLKARPPDHAVLVLDEDERQLRLSTAVSRLPVDQPLALVIGPEGGLTREEVASLVALGALPVTLGALVLRTETAALAALAVLRHLDGHLG